MRRRQEKAGPFMCVEHLGSGRELLLIRRIEFGRDRSTFPIWFILMEFFPKKANRTHRRMGTFDLIRCGGGTPSQNLVHIT